ncbi:MAG TPA: hypothetical protein VIH66_00880, partial [Gammaproteobacteria bacterium]
DADDIIARSHADAPEIDGIVIVTGQQDVQPGEFIAVTITGANEHDLYAVPEKDRCNNAQQAVSKRNSLHPA